jgi:hypothetical protein
VAKRNDAMLLPVHQEAFVAENVTERQTIFTKESHLKDLLNKGVCIDNGKITG